MSPTATRINSLTSNYSGTELLHAAAIRTAAELLTDTGNVISIAVLDEYVARYRTWLLEALACATAGDER